MSRMLCGRRCGGHEALGPLCPGNGTPISPCVGPLGRPGRQRPPRPQELLWGLSPCLVWALGLTALVRKEGAVSHFGFLPAANACTR